MRVAVLVCFAAQFVVWTQGASTVASVPDGTSLGGDPGPTDAPAPRTSSAAVATADPTTGTTTTYTSTTSATRTTTTVTDSSTSAVTRTDTDTASDFCHMNSYNGPQVTAAGCFCELAENPGCSAQPCHCIQGCDDVAWRRNGLSSFFNIHNASGCSDNRALLTIPQTYVSDILDLEVSCKDGEAVLRTMLTTALDIYRQHVEHHAVEVSMCFHCPLWATVPWLHLHTMCSTGKLQDLPHPMFFVGRCALMSNETQAAELSRSFLQWAQKDCLPTAGMTRDDKRMHRISDLTMVLCLFVFALFAFLSFSCCAWRWFTRSRRTMTSMQPLLAEVSRRSGRGP